jgi:hypothetical protein
MKRLAILVCLLGGACSSALDGVEQGLTHLKGQPIDAAVAKLGRPTGQQSIMDETAYIWSTSFDSQVGSGALSPVMTNSCRIRLFTLKGSPLIRGGDVEGHERACRPYADALN